MFIRGIRGATTVHTDQSELIINATQELLDTIMARNIGLNCEDIACAFFTMTEDLISVHPALAARKIGWDHVPMICAKELSVPGSLPRCIRVLIEWNTDKQQSAIKHVYLREAAILRPDLDVS